MFLAALWWSNVCSLESDSLFRQRNWLSKRVLQAALPPNPERALQGERGAPESGKPRRGREKGAEVGRGLISFPLPGHTLALDINRTLRLWTVSLDMSHQHVVSLYSP